VFALAPDLAATFALARTVVLALAPDLALAPLLVLALALDLAAVFALPAALGRAFAPPNRTAVRPLPFAAALAGLRREPCFFSCSTIALPRSAGLFTVRTPARSSAANLSAAVPLPPDTMAPAWPIRLPGGAVTPAM